MSADSVFLPYKKILTEGCDRISHKGQQRGNYSAPLIRGEGLAEDMKEVESVNICRFLRWNRPKLMDEFA